MILLSNSLRKLNTVNLTNVNSIHRIHFFEKVGSELYGSNVGTHTKSKC
ncbi:hypothetical protein LEP1GSC035_2964 [Leptospira noguchii str. 2007001578]|nr:hypothetical protein LEP1GSC035_2964 [Leptospira noguchii str. 2007001578]